MWTPKLLHGWQSEVSGWLLRCAQAELWHLDELRDEPLEERGALEEHRLPRRRRAAVLGGGAGEPKKKDRGGALKGPCLVLLIE